MEALSLAAFAGIMFVLGKALIAYNETKRQERVKRFEELKAESKRLRKRGYS